MALMQWLSFETLVLQVNDNKIYLSVLNLKRGNTFLAYLILR